MVDLYRYLTSIIINNGPIPLDYFFSTVSHHYYNKARDSISKVGDFITAPEISQMFGEVVAVWIANTWLAYVNKLNTECISKLKFKLILIELGPGNGTLMSDLLRSLSKIKPLYDQLKEIIFIESSLALSIKQKNLFSTYNNLAFSWYRNIEELTLIDFTEGGQYFPILFVIANEFFDALPIKQLIRTAESPFFSEIKVGLRSGGEFFLTSEFGIFSNILNPSASQLFNNNVFSESKLIKDLEPGDILEVSPTAYNTASIIAKLLSNYHGASLIVDYGYLKLPKVSSLQAVYKHTKLSSIFTNLGDCDLSAMVDFISLQNTFNRFSTLKSSISTQRDFLLKYGIVDRANYLSKLTFNKEAINRQLDRLISNEHMGELFKVLEVFR